MRIAGLNLSHNGSICLLDDGEINFYIEEERLSKRKYDNRCYHALKKLINYNPEYISVVSLNRDNENDKEIYKNIFIDYFPNSKIINMQKQHHLCHASGAFYSSGFDEALCFVFDGSGSSHGNKREIETIYFAKYPNIFEVVYKHYYNSDVNEPIFKNDKVLISHGYSVGWVYEKITRELGFNSRDAGKTMGLSSYGEKDPRIPPLFLNGITNDNFIFNGNFCLDRDVDLVDVAYAIQRDTGSYVMDKIKEYTKKYNCKNVVISGGYGLNCVSNYRYLDLDFNLYVEPISHDGGTSIGAAKYVWHSITKSCEKKKQKTLYYGFEYSVPNINNTSYEQVSKLIIQGNPICVFQGKSEAGPRALGNRSILYSPFEKNGKNILNELKGREKFRPFAAIVLEEYANEWFYMKNLKSTPFMMYAVDCREIFADKIPNVLHIDNTSRIQTINEEQNYHLYNLIKTFYDLTGIPMLLNTSFNLAGNPLVETVKDALKTLKKSNFTYLYFPETQSLISE